MRNQKSETRNPKEIRSPKSQRGHGEHSSFGFRIFFLPSDFWFRISDFRALTVGITVLCLALAGCGSAVSEGHNTALDSMDLTTMTDQMSASIIADPAVQQTFAGNGPLKVVMQPVINQMHAEILTIGEGDAFMSRLRALLSHHAPQEFTWIMNRDAFYRLRQQELQVDPGPSPEAINPEYALTATFTSMANENGQGRSDYYVCNYSLTSLKDRSVLWSKSYEVQKKAVKGFLD